MSIRAFVFAAFILTLIGTSNLLAKIDFAAQSSTDSIEIAVKKLQLKLLLSDNQCTKIKTILREVDFRSFTEENKAVKLKPINDKVDKLLTRKQQVKFEILKSKWLDELFENREENKSATY